MPSVVVRGKHGKLLPKSDQQEKYLPIEPVRSDDVEKPGGVRAGDRAPDAPCVDGNGATRRLFEISSCRGVWATVSQASKSDPPLSIAELGTF